MGVTPSEPRHAPFGRQMTYIMHFYEIPDTPSSLHVT